MRLVAVLALALLAACGKQGDLSYPLAPGATPQPVDPARTPAAMLKRTTQAEPARVDDTLKKSEDRRDDRFNLPPPG